jgi:glutamate-1-semialdehyde 2,1-aminomutase
MLLICPLLRLCEQDERTYHPVKANHKKIMQEAAAYMPGGIHHTISHNPNSAPEFLFTHGDGAYLYTTDGRRFLDTMLGHGSLLLGHCAPTVVEAVTTQAALGNTFTHITQPSIELARMMVEDVPCADKVRFTNSGTEAVILALRLVRAHTAKNKILKFEGAYHGFADGLLYSTNYGYPDRWPEPPSSDPDSLGIPEGQQDLVLIAPWNDLERTTRIVRDNIEDLAGIIVEPVMRGLSSQPGFLEGIRELATDHDTPLIFDEVRTGFRLALGGAQEYYGVTPDLSTFGKGIGSGYPLGAVAGNDQIMGHLNPASLDEERVFSLGTFHSNAVSTAAGVATIRALRQPGTYEHLKSYGDQLRAGLEELFQRFDLPVQMSGEANIVEWFFTTEPITDYRSSLATNLALSGRISSEMRSQNIFGGGGNFSTEHGDTELSLTLESMEACLVSVRDSGELNA